MPTPGTLTASTVPLRFREFRVSQRKEGPPPTLQWRVRTAPPPAGPLQGSAAHPCACLSPCHPSGQRQVRPVHRPSGRSLGTARQGKLTLRGQILQKQRRTPREPACPTRGAHGTQGPTEPCTELLRPQHPGRPARGAWHLTHTQCCAAHSVKLCGAS